MHPNGNIFSNNKLWPSEGWPEMAHQHLPSMAKQVNRSPHTKRGERKKKKKLQTNFLFLEQKRPSQLLRSVSAHKEPATKKCLKQEKRSDRKPMTVTDEFLSEKTRKCQSVAFILLGHSTWHPSTVRCYVKAGIIERTRFMDPVLRRKSRPIAWRGFKFSVRLFSNFN